MMGEKTWPEVPITTPRKKKSTRLVLEKEKIKLFL